MLKRLTLKRLTLKNVVTQKVDTHKVVTHKVDTQKVATHKVDTQKVDAQKVNTQKDRHLKSFDTHENSKSTLHLPVRATPYPKETTWNEPVDLITRQLSISLQDSCRYRDFNYPRAQSATCKAMRVLISTFSKLTLQWNILLSKAIIFHVV